MREDLTELVFVLDKSGSMCGLESDTIGGFNSMLAKQRGGEGRVLVSTVLFSDESFVLHDRVDVDEVADLTDDDYVVGGCTALFDAVGGALRHIGNVHKYARPEDVPSKTLVVITTDGMENASRRYRKAEIKRMIERQKKKYGWEFIFLGANIDAAEAAEDIGIDACDAADFLADSEGVETNFMAISRGITMMRECCAAPQAALASVRADMAKRGGTRPKRR